MTFSNDYHLWITILLFLYLPSELLAFKCYICNSYTDAQCMGNDLDKFKMECKGAAVGCRKIHFFVKYTDQDNTEERIERQCAKTSQGYGCKQVFGTNGKRFKSLNCECGSDLCNTGTTPRLSCCFLMLSTLASLLFYLKSD
uniref:Protein sleepless n=1 Tax=Biomphalaria glabrata TaxID=6526 RepID=A0A2C9KU83_BIOGL